MRFSSTMPCGLRNPDSRAWAAVAGLLLATSLGCQVFAPSAVGTLAASREEKRVLELAETDPFPSPTDVGLSSAGDER